MSNNIDIEAHGHGDDIRVSVFEGGILMDEFTMDRDVAQTMVTAFSAALASETETETETDPDEAQAVAMRAALVGLPVKVEEDARAILTEGAQEKNGSETATVFFDGEVTGTIVSDDEGYWDLYDQTLNFVVRSDSGLTQTVEMAAVHPLDPDDLKKRVASVGAQFATARGIVPGATVRLPGLLGALFGTAKVTAVEDGIASVVVDDIGIEDEFPAFTLIAEA